MGILRTVRAMTRTSAGTKSLDAKYYVSQEIYAQESTRIFGQAWMCVGREEQPALILKRLAAPRLVFILGMT